MLVYSSSDLKSSSVTYSPLSGMELSGRAAGVASTSGPRSVVLSVLVLVLVLVYVYANHSLLSPSSVVESD